MQSAETVAHGVQQGWVDATHPPLFAASGDAYFLLLPVEDGERGAFKQVVMVNASVRIMMSFLSQVKGSSDQPMAG